MAVDERFSNDFRETRIDEPLGTRSEIITGPVSDWATDFSHLEPEWSADPYPIQDDLRQRCPIAHTERFGGGWLPTRYEDVSAIAYDVLGMTDPLENQEESVSDPVEQQIANASTQTE